ncbi:transposase [Larkinella rosea]|uniref:Transposase n=1 Tax=Larkinella rosea TaxID=2025312 RepID=A0A3P1BFZ2_9BACT|nr:transposase [Larkinella rosea]RRA99785.1 transposase [Larkinella rosea]
MLRLRNMNDLYKHKYRIPSARLQSWDYGTNGAYFVTICTHEKHHAFGEIREGEMHRNAAGKIAAEIWQLLPTQFPFVILDAFVIMPNHMHGLLYIDKPGPGSRDAINRVSTPADTNQDPGGIAGNKNPMLHDNLSRIIRWYKGRTTFEIRKFGKDADHQGRDAINRVSTVEMAHFAWQARFHDHIVRTSDTFLRIQAYVLNNPLLWEADKFYF